MRFLRFGSARVRGAFGVAVTAYALVGVFSVTGHAGQARQVTAGVYSAAQATRGQALYKDQCLPCHGEMLEGVVGPALTGDDFLTDLGGASVGQLVQKIQSTMPQQAPGTLTQAQAIDLSAFILQSEQVPGRCRPDGRDDGRGELPRRGRRAGGSRCRQRASSRGRRTSRSSCAP